MLKNFNTLFIDLLWQRRQLGEKMKQDLSIAKELITSKHLVNLIKVKGIFMTQAVDVQGF